MAVKPFRGLSFLGLTLVALCLLLSVARAQDESDAPQADPPDRAARLAYLKGEVSLQPTGEEEWAPAMLNRPLTTGDKLWTERGARAELQVGQAAIRLDGETGFSFLNLDDDTVQMRMTAGTIIVDVRSLEDREQIEIDTPNIALSILRPGSYRVEVNDAGDATTVKLGDGEAEANGPSTNTLVHSRQMVTFRGEDELVADWGTLGPADDFDNWSMEREHRDDRLASSPSSRYVSPDVTGYDELDEYGSWSSEPEYGYVWTPRRVVVGWSPYQFGRWVWVSPWGWTWIDDSPWGYAPFHYGRWAHVRNRWCWVPGPRHVRAVYAPALVGWVGGRGINVSWFPLGPRDIYVPGRRFSRHWVERVNVSNTIIVNREHIRDVYDRRGPGLTYHNRSVPGAITSVARSTFTSAQRTGDRRVRLDPRELNDSQDHGGVPHIAPVRDSRLGGVARMNPRVPPAMANRQVVVKRDPPPSGARFARRVQPSEDMAQPPLRGVRPQDRSNNANRGSFQDRVAERAGERASERPDGHDRNRDNRADRPQRNDREASERPTMDNAPSAQLSPAEQRSMPAAVREARERQMRDDRPPRDAARRDGDNAPNWQQREQQQPRERDDRPANSDSQYPQYSQRPQRTRDAVREAVARQLEQRERQQQQQRERSDDPPRQEYRPEYRQPERRQESQPRPEPREQPRQEYRQPERRQDAQPSPQPRQESRPSPAERRSDPQGRQGDGNRPNRR